MLKFAEYRRKVSKESNVPGSTSTAKCPECPHPPRSTSREKPPTKAAQIQALWPDIKAALDAGHSLKSVCECLEADGIKITVPALGSYITRMRRKSLPVVTPLPPAVIGSAARRNDPGKLAETADGKRESSFDPLAKIRERQGKHPGFDYRPQLADPKELI